MSSCRIEKSVKRESRMKHVGNGAEEVSDMFSRNVGCQPTKYMAFLSQKTEHFNQITYFMHHTYLIKCY
jgi:hypothetical protein